MRRLIHTLLFKMYIWHTPDMAQDVEMFSMASLAALHRKPLDIASNKGNQSDKINDGPSSMQKFLPAS